MLKNLGFVLIYFSGLQLIFWRFTADKKLEQNHEERRKLSEMIDQLLQCACCDEK